jgi:transposase
MHNKYLYRSRISEAKFKEIIKLFSVDLNATQISKLTNLSRNSINKILYALRIRIAGLCEIETPFKGEIEVDESFFGARRQKGKRGRGAYGKPLFLVFTNVMGRFIQRLWKIVPDQRFRLL